MRYTAELTYGAFPVADVAGMHLDREFRRRLCEAQRFNLVAVDVTGPTGAPSVQVEQSQSTARLPGFARTILGSEIRLVQREVWSQPDAADLTIVIPGKPFHFTGSIRLAEGPAGTVKMVDGDLRFPVPLIGAKVEQMAADMLHKALAREKSVAVEWLSGSP